MFVHHLIKTDNKSVANKVFLRRKATEKLDGLRVLDLFAGNNVLWNCIDTERYYGVELISDKGINLNADAKRVIDSLDLSAFKPLTATAMEFPMKSARKYLRILP